MGLARVLTGFAEGQVLLAGVTATGASAAIDARAKRHFTVYIKAANVTTGGTMKVQSLAPHGDWVDIDSRTINANGDTVLAFEGAFSAVRANLSARTDGTYTVSIESF